MSTKNIIQKSSQQHKKQHPRKIPVLKTAEQLRLKIDNRKYYQSTLFDLPEPSSDNGYGVQNDL